MNHLLMNRIRAGAVQVDARQRELRVGVVANGVVDVKISAMRRYTLTDASGSFRSRPL
jgi:hypothetical protein